ncbi:MAG: hypothetical protein NTW49_11635 [Bacteroidia bacterium]|nr:hypothetical protein [Bacteroidia bacterium]
MESDQQQRNNENSGLSLFSMNKTYRNLFLNSTVSSLITFLVSFFIVSIIYQLFTLLIAKYIGYEAIWKYDKISFPLDSTSHLWRRRFIILLFASGPLISFFIGSLFYFMFIRRNPENSYYSLFTFWCTIHSFALFFSSFIAGSITNDGFGFVISWLYIGPIMRIIYSILAAIAMIAIGIRLNRYFFRIDDHDILAGINSRNTFSVFLVLIPWAAGYFILSVIKSPGISTVELLTYIFSIFLIAPTFSSFAHNTAFSLTPMKNQKFPVTLLIILVLLVLCYRIGLNEGIHFNQSHTLYHTQ